MKKLISKFLVLSLMLSLCLPMAVFAEEDASEEQIQSQEEISSGEEEPAEETPVDPQPSDEETEAGSGSESGNETETREESESSGASETPQESENGTETGNNPTTEQKPSGSDREQASETEKKPETDAAAESEMETETETESETETETDAGLDGPVHVIGIYGYTAPENMSEADVFNYLISCKWPNGSYVTAVQAAAIMGNIEGEAGKGLNWGEKAYLIEGNYSSLGTQYRPSGYINPGAFVYSVDHGIVPKSDFCFSHYFGLNSAYWGDVGASNHSGHYGFGICQWTSEASGEKGDLYDFCRSHGYSIGSVRGQLAFLMSNVTPRRFQGYWRGKSNAARYDIFMTTTSTDAAVEAFMNGYLRPASANHPGRYTSAARIYEEYAGASERFVRALYQSCLGRDPEDAQLNAQVGALLRGDSSAAQMTYELLFSEDFTEQYLCNDHFVEMLYEVLLERNADSVGYASWTSALDSGMTREEVLKAMTASQEYQKLCESRGIEAGHVETELDQLTSKEIEQNGMTDQGTVVIGSVRCPEHHSENIEQPEIGAPLGL